MYSPINAIVFVDCATVVTNTAGIIVVHQNLAKHYEYRITIPDQNIFIFVTLFIQ